MEPRPLRIRLDSDTMRVKGPSLLTRWRNYRAKKGEWKVQVNLNEEAFNAVVVVAVAFAVVAIAVAIMWYHVNNTNKFAQGNYCEAARTGQAGTYWVKCGAPAAVPIVDQK